MEERKEGTHEMGKAERNKVVKGGLAIELLDFLFLSNTLPHYFFREVIFVLIVILIQNNSTTNGS